MKIFKIVLVVVALFAVPVWFFTGEWRHNRSMIDLN